MHFTHFSRTVSFQACSSTFPSLVLLGDLPHWYVPLLCVHYCLHRTIAPPLFLPNLALAEGRKRKMCDTAVLLPPIGSSCFASSVVVAVIPSSLSSSSFPYSAQALPPPINSSRPDPDPFPLVECADDPKQLFFLSFFP